MTHTLHRRGSAESLSGDYVVLMLRAIGVNDTDYVPKLQEFLRICLRHNPVNIGCETKGSMYETRLRKSSPMSTAIRTPFSITLRRCPEYLKTLKRQTWGFP